MQGLQNLRRSENYRSLNMSQQTLKVMRLVVVIEDQFIQDLSAKNVTPWIANSRGGPSSKGVVGKRLLHSSNCAIIKSVLEVRSSRFEIAETREHIVGSPETGQRFVPEKVSKHLRQ